MTLAEGITRVLKRMGLSSSNTDYKDMARTYLNMIQAEIAPLVPWWWLHKETTFATVASTRTYTPISGNVAHWQSFWNETHNHPVEIVGQDEYNFSDVDRSDSGTVHKVYVGGTDATTGYPTLELWRIPDSAQTIRVSYRKDIDEWTSSNDSTDFLTLGIPRVIESVLIYGAASLGMEENGDDSGAARESGNFHRALDAAKRQNVAMQGNRRYVPSPPETNALITVDSTLAVP